MNVKKKEKEKEMHKQKSLAGMKKTELKVRNNYLSANALCGISSPNPIASRKKCDCGYPGDSQ